MKSTKLILATSLLLVTASLTFAGPGPQYWQDRLARRARVTTTATPIDAAKPAATCCRTVTVQRPIASHKVFIPVQAVECSGCAAMAAGEKCPMS